MVLCKLLRGQKHIKNKIIRIKKEMGSFPEWNMKYRNFRCRVIITDGRIFYKKKFRKNAKKDGVLTFRCLSRYII
ncbi:hypothetical protein C0033_03885 [Clostridium sp. chh4-2]|nr:hypothetical protein C0033_03885 [Clostridium sp. chh4-2]